VGKWNARGNSKRRIGPSIQEYTPELAAIEKRNNYGARRSVHRVSGGGNEVQVSIAILPEQLPQYRSHATIGAATSLIH
jgi:hypothetical protein